jgi:bacterial/archaeal transporter family protein
MARHYLLVMGLWQRIHARSQSGQVKRADKMRWQLFALGSAFFAGLTAIFGKLGVEGMNSNLATLIRTVIILGMTAIIVTVRDEWQMPQALEMRPVAFLVLSGAATGFSWLLFYRALQLAPASLVTPIDKLSVAFTILLGVIFLREALTIKLAAGGLLILSGVLILAWP